ncbi:MAG: hypothetical protein HN725_22545 [Alphaproteobacteria bacterium]|nr:hypothetical protein [Alphaproteobacteria bacterium]MBT4084404.1 hypothetical protein [Alphaproteobacteria bacterium]MBT4545626.1 hypothetical protein [Alphaproteobacteria bacterium]MBT7748083.1 hypothetical protein [Alphaproteobacteria bacterium]
MNFQSFKASVADAQPPSDLPAILLALWHAAKGEWEKAHELSQADESAAGSWVHAYLHRVEGDNSNAAYWYRRAGEPVCQLSLEDEWEQIAEALTA